LQLGEVSTTFSTARLTEHSFAHMHYHKICCWQWGLLYTQLSCETAQVGKTKLAKLLRIELTNFFMFGCHFETSKIVRL